MTLYHRDKSAEIHNGDCLQVLRTLPDSSVDSCVTDPPYGLAFMGKKWDYDVPSVELWQEVLRVLKPGGHLLAFAGTRTQHRMAVRIEDAGFEIRDMIAWVYGSGFPKSLDVSKAIDKRGGLTPWQQEFAEHLRCIKPASLRAADINAHIANGTKSNFWGHFIDTKCQPLLPTVEQYRRLREILPIDPSWDEQFLPPAEREVVGQKTSGIANKDEGPRHTIGASKAVEVNITAPSTEAAKQWEGWGTALKPAMEPITVARKPFPGTVAENVLQHGTGALNVDGCRVGDESGRFPANLIHDGSDEVVGLFPETAPSKQSEGVSRKNGVLKHHGENARPSHDTFERITEIEGYTDTGSAARFFYCAKADAAERRNSKHPTVKPVALMRYLVRLVCPAGGVVLDPFAGSGTTIEAARLEHCRAIGIEREAEYCADILERLRQGVLF